MLVQAIGSQGNGFLRALLGIGGVLSLVIGGICVVNDASERILVLFVVIGWLANGIAYLIVGLRNKQSASRGFYLFFGTLQVVLALLIIAWPSATRDRARACDRDRLAHHRCLRGVGVQPHPQGRSRRAGRDRQPVASTDRCDHQSVAFANGTSSSTSRAHAASSSA